MSDDYAQRQRSFASAQRAYDNQMPDDPEEREERERIRQAREDAREDAQDDE